VRARHVKRVGIRYAYANEERGSCSRNAISFITWQLTSDVGRR